MSLSNFFTKHIPFLNTKSANIQQSSTPIQPYQLISNNYSITCHTPRTLVAQNNHWVNVCVNKTSNIIATIEPKLYYQNKSGKKVLNGKQIKDDLVEIIDHPILNILKKVNPSLNYTDFISLIQQYLQLIGNAYVYLKKNNNNLVELYPLLAEYVTIILDTQGQISKYKYENPYTNKEIIYGKDEIIHFSNYQAGNLISGRGELEGCIAAVERYNYYDISEVYTSKNMARPDFIVSFKQNLSEKEQRDITNAFFKKFGTSKNIGKPLVTSECSIIPIGFAPKDMDYQNGRNWARNEIINSFGVPESIVSLNSSNYASAQVSNYQYFTYTIIPKLRKMYEKINEVIMPMYDDKLFLWFEENIEVDPEIQARILTTYKNAGVMQTNEIREKLGLEALEDEETYIITDTTKTTTTMKEDK